jgi:farnesyl diphosphate synthase
VAWMERIHRRKTGALFRASLTLGGLAAGADDVRLAALDGYGRAFGLAFQIADDLLDAEGDEEAAGKALRKDEQAGKETFLSLLGPERAREQAQMLVEQAVQFLSSYGEEADLLRALAWFIVERDR